MTKIVVPLQFSNLSSTPGSAATGFKKFYLKNGQFKVYDVSEKDLVLDRLLDGYTPTPGVITSADSVLSSIEKLAYAVSTILSGGGNWGSITGNITDQLDLINYLNLNYYNNSNPAGYITLSDIPPQLLQDLQSVLTQGATAVDLGIILTGTLTPNYTLIDNFAYYNYGAFGDYAQLSSLELNIGYNDLYSIIQAGNITLSNTTTGSFGSLYDGYLELSSDGTNIVNINETAITINGIQYLLPTGLASQIATLLDIPTAVSELTNDVGYITQDNVEEYADLTSFPVIGVIGTVYIALDTGLFYSWNGSAYVLSAPPNTGITGGGIVNRLAKFTPNGTTVGSSNFSDTGTEGRYSLSATNFISFYPGANVWLRLQRVNGNKIDFILGNPGISQTASLSADNAFGVEIIASAATAFLALKAGGFEGLKVLPTGRILLTQNPDSGNSTTDQILVRDPSGNIKQLPYPGSSVSDNWYNYQQIHENMPVFGGATLNNISGVVYNASGATSRSFSSITTYQRNQRMGLVTGTTGNAAQLRQTQLLFTRNSGFDFWFKFGMAENATANDVRFFGGISSNTGVFGNTEPNTILNAVGVIRPTGSDNFWFMHNDNSGIATTINLGTDFPANTIETDAYIGNIKTSGSTIIITVWRVGTTFIETRTLTTDIPTLTQGLNCGFYIVDSSGPSTPTGFDFMGSKLLV